MFFGSNLQFLRRKAAMTQEQLGQQMGVSRQTVSKWESGQIPELSKLLELSDLFSCPLDDLLRQELSSLDSPVRFLRVKGFSMARYTIISPHAENDVHSYLEHWCAACGLEERPYLSWSFPYVSPEQKKQFGFTGFSAACVLPEAFHPSISGPEITAQGDCSYAVLTIPEPRGRDSRQIARGIQTILEALRESGIRKTARKDCLPCFEYHCIHDDVPCADIFLQCEGHPEEEVFKF